MTNDELYLNISKLIDTAFKEQESRDEAMEGRLNHRMDLLESRMDRMEERLDAKIDAVEKSLNAKIDAVETSLNAKIEKLDAKVDGINESLGSKMHGINLRLENEIIPNYTEIKDCYISTSLRYQESIDKVDRMQIDIDVLRSVVGKHEQMLCGVPA